MKAVYACAGAVLGVVACASLLRADPYTWYPQQAPGAWGPGSYVTNPWYGTCDPCCPLYHPPCSPVGSCPPRPGCLSTQCGPQRGPEIATFPSHPFARGPRDYFMAD